MYWGLKKVYLRFLVRNPKSRARLKSDIALLRKPACLASSLDIREKISATATRNWLLSELNQCWHCCSGDVLMMRCVASEHKLTRR